MATLTERAVKAAEEASLYMKQIWPIVKDLRTRYDSIASKIATVSDKFITRDEYVALQESVQRLSEAVDRRTQLLQEQENARLQREDRRLELAAQEKMWTRSQAPAIDTAGLTEVIKASVLAKSAGMAIDPQAFLPSSQAGVPFVSTNIGIVGGDSDLVMDNEEDSDLE